MNADNIKAVTIPARVVHWGIYKTTINLSWTCPVCGGPRGKIKRVFSYDGSRRLVVDGWENPCGHVDLYKDCRAEARTNGINRETLDQ